MFKSKEIIKELRRHLEDEKQQVGSVLTTFTGAVVPTSSLEKYESRKSEGEIFSIAKSDEDKSKQMVTEGEWSDAHDLISHPYDVDAILTLYESNPYFYRCVNQIATDAAGLGWTLNARDGSKKDISNAAGKKPYIEFLDELTVLQML